MSPKAEAFAEEAIRAVSDAIRGKAFDTVIGKLTYDNKGDVLNPEYVWFVWSKGQYNQM